MNEEGTHTGTGARGSAAGGRGREGRGGMGAAGARPRGPSCLPEQAVRHGARPAYAV